jgi:hypothetical protein
LQGFDPQPDPPGDAYGRPGGAQGIIIDTSIDNPDIKPGGDRGIIIDTSIDNPDLMPGG